MKRNGIQEYGVGEVGVKYMKREARSSFNLYYDNVSQTIIFFISFEYGDYGSDLFLPILLRKESSVLGRCKMTYLQP